MMKMLEEMVSRSLSVSIREQIQDLELTVWGLKSLRLTFRCHLSHLLVLLSQNLLDAFNEMLYADDIVLISERIDEWVLKMAFFRHNGLKVNLQKTKVVVSGCIPKYWLSMRKVNSCKMYSSRLRDSLVFC